MSNNVLHTELHLFDLISQGDESAFEALFKLYVPQIQPVVLQIVRSETIVRDIIQEIFLQLWLGRDKLSQIEEPRHWIFRIAYNHCFLYLKRQQLREQAYANVGFEQDHLPHPHDTTDHVDFAETKRLVHQAIAQLGAQSKKIYQLNRVSGMKPGDIAALLNISTQSVRNSLTRSGKVIRDYLTQHGIIVPLILILLQLT